MAALGYISCSVSGYENKFEQKVLDAPRGYEDLPPEIIFHIFKYLGPYDQLTATCVCQNWRIVGEDEGLKRVREYCFGKAKWNRYFGDIGIEPPLPPNIEQILNSACIFWPNEKVRDTHLLVLVPEKVNGKAFHLDFLRELIKNPKTGHKTNYKFYCDSVKNELGKTSERSHWVLMTRDVIPNSRSKTHDDQKALVASHASRSEIPYELPKALEASTAILMHHVETGTALYTDGKLGKQHTYTRCQEKVCENRWPAAIGGFAAGGLYVYLNFTRRKSTSGVGCCQRF